MADTSEDEREWEIANYSDRVERIQRGAEERTRARQEAARRRAAEQSRREHTVQGARERYNEDVYKTSGVYMEDALIIVDKYIDGFNYAKNKICRERYRPMRKETVYINEDNTIDLYGFERDVISVVRVLKGDAEISDWEQGPDFTLVFPTGAGEEVEIEYYYIIPDFPNNPTAEALATPLDFPEAVVDYRILCYYACYEYHLIKGSDRDLDKTGFFINKFNDGFLHIPRNVKGPKRVKDRSLY